MSSDDASGSGAGASDADAGDGERVPVRVRHADGEVTLRVERGSLLRDALLTAAERDDVGVDLSPYTAATSRLNCGGRGLCATCGVRILDGPSPTHWHDQLADRFGYPRLSCQVTVSEPMTVELVTDKRVWGGRRQSPSADR